MSPIGRMSLIEWPQFGACSSRMSATVCHSTYSTMCVWPLRSRRPARWRTRFGSTVFRSSFNVVEKSSTLLAVSFSSNKVAVSAAFGSFSALRFISFLLRVYKSGCDVTYIYIGSSDHPISSITVPEFLFAACQTHATQFSCQEIVRGISIHRSICETVYLKNKSVASMK